MVTEIVLICLLERLGDEGGREGGREEGEAQIRKLRAREGREDPCDTLPLRLVHLY